MTEKEFLNELKKLGIHWVNRSIDEGLDPLPKLLDKIARHCFVYPVDNADDVIGLIRYQMYKLDSTGLFEFEAPTGHCGIRVRFDWLVEFVNTHHEWNDIIEECIRNNYYFVIPSSKSAGHFYTFHGSEKKEDCITVLQDGIKGPPAIFYMNWDGSIGCVNYPGSYKFMTQMEFLSILRRISDDPIYPDYKKWVWRMTEQDDFQKEK